MMMMMVMMNEKEKRMNISRVNGEKIDRGVIITEREREREIDLHEEGKQERRL